MRAFFGCCSYGGEGTEKKYTVKAPKRTNGFADDVIDISEGRVWPRIADGNEIDMENDVYEANGEYQKLDLSLFVPFFKLRGQLTDGSSDDTIVDEESNGIQYDVTGPGVKKVLKKEAYDSDYYISQNNTCITVADPYEYFCFDYVGSDRLVRWLNVPSDNDVMTDIHVDLYFTITSFELDELRKYNSAREFVNAEKVMQNDDAYTGLIDSEKDIRKKSRFHELGDDIDTYCREYAEDKYAVGYKYDVETNYSTFIVIDENSQYLDKFLDAAGAGEFCAYTHKGGKYWFAKIECVSEYYAKALGEKYATDWLTETFGDNVPAHELVIAPYDCRDYYIYYEFTNRDVINAWLNEMENWDGHWTYLLYGEASVPELNSSDTEPGYEQSNWVGGCTDQILGKTTVHHPETYTFYVKDPGVYTLTATIDGCTGVATSTFRLARSLESCEVTGIEDRVYTGKKQTQNPVIKDGDKVLVNGTDYEITYEDNVNAGFSFFTITGKGSYYGSIRDYFIIESIPLKVTASDIVRSYSASAQKFAIGAKSTGGVLSYKTGSDKVSVDKNGKVTIKGGFSGTTWIDITASGKNYKSATKRITLRVPTRVTIGKVKSNKAGKMTVTWKRSSRVSGYQIRYSRTVKFVKKKAVTINKNSTTSKTIGNLAKGGSIGLASLILFETCKEGRT